MAFRLKFVWNTSVNNRKHKPQKVRKNLIFGNTKLVLHICRKTKKNNNTWKIMLTELCTKQYTMQN